jgi:peptidoglycan hydrolase-like protein with peptidoglycan-binding domain
MRKLVIATVATLSAFVLAAIATPPAEAQDQATRAAVDVNMDAMPTLNTDGVRKVQLALQKKGINPGPVDGIYGPLTKEAVRTFQSRYGIKATGDVDNQTLVALGEVDLAI